jgi:hypothetical protein
MVLTDGTMAQPVFRKIRHIKFKKVKIQSTSIICEPLCNETFSVNNDYEPWRGLSSGHAQTPKGVNRQGPVFDYFTSVSGSDVAATSSKLHGVTISGCFLVIHTVPPSFRRARQKSSQQYSKDQIDPPGKCVVTGSHLMNLIPFGSLDSFQWR